MDDILIRRTDAEGRTVGFDRFMGMFTARAAIEEAQHIPILRDKLRQLLEEEHLLAGSHDYKELVAAFNSLPKEELLRASVDELRQELDAMVNSFGESDVKVAMLPDPRRKMVVVMVLLPRDHFSSEVRVRIQEALARRLNGTLVYYHLDLREGYSAHLHFCFAAPHPNLAQLPAMQAEVTALTRTWTDRLGNSWCGSLENHMAASWRTVIATRSPAEYQASTDVARAIKDIELIEAALAGGSASVEICPPPEGVSDATQLRIFQVHEAGGAVRVDAAAAEFRYPGAVRRCSRVET